MFLVEPYAPLMYPNACGICKEGRDDGREMIDTLVDREDFMGRSERIYVCDHCLGECLKTWLGDEPVPEI